MKVACSWSGGKDSCLACWKAMAEGYDVRCLVNLVSAGEGRDSFHGVKGELMCMQSEAMQIPMIQRQTTWEGYEQVFKEIMQELREMGVEGLVTGDMDIVEHRQWVENTCREFGFKPLLPLWGLSPEGVLGDFIDERFEAVVVCVKSDALGEEWLGRNIDKRFMEDIKGYGLNSGVNICGELGEYHSFVCDGPLYKRRISLTHGAQVWRDGYGFLDITEAELTEKGA